MAKNIVVFSDGTGQDGAVRLDARLSNVYKLFRASRIGADTSIDPSKQIAFYDPGLGTDADSHGWDRISRSIYKIWASIAGRGIGTNIADCYEFIINHWSPGDRIFIFGFSRGAYTARCVAQVLSLCGVPTHAANDPSQPFRRFGRPARQVAERAVHEVYEYGAGYDRALYEADRNELARRFRTEFGSDDNGAPNANPYFIGVFDTVAALGAAGVKRILLIAVLIALGLVAVGIASGIVYWPPPWLFWRVFAIIAAPAILWAAGTTLFAIIAGLVLAVASVASGLFGIGTVLPPIPFWGLFALIGLTAGLVALIKLRHDSYRYIDNFPKGRKSHHIRWEAANYDRGLSGHVGYARQAGAIDETRADFPRVEWGKKDVVRKKVGDEPEPFIQLYFAGNHSDIGGSYPETESRLSDVALQWMLEEATGLPEPLIVEPSRLRPFPDPTGMQHNEPESVRENMLWWVPSWAPWLRQGWSEKYRTVNGYAMHPSVFQRFGAAKVDENGICRAYRPHNLRNDRRFAWGYDKVDPEFAAILGSQQKAAYQLGKVTFRIGETNGTLADLLKTNDANSAHGIFPGNPRPDADSAYCDALALSILKAEIEKLSLKALPLSRLAEAASVAEAGLLILDIEERAARQLAISFAAMTIVAVDGSGRASMIDVTPPLKKEDAQ